MAVAEVLRSPEVDDNVRQMAAVQLRQYIAAHWNRHVDDFKEPEPPAEVSSARLHFQGHAERQRQYAQPRARAHLRTVSSSPAGRSSTHPH